MTDSHAVLVRDAVDAYLHDAEPDGTHARHTCRLCGRAGLTTGAFVYGSAVLELCPGRPFPGLSLDAERTMRLSAARALLRGLRVEVANGRKDRLPFIRHHLAQQRAHLLTIDALRSGR